MRSQARKWRGSRLAGSSQTGKSRSRTYAQNRAAAKGQQRPHQHTLSRGHAREPGGARAGQGSHQHRLGLVVGVMRREHQLGTEVEAGGLKPGVARGASGGLSRARAEGSAAFDVGHAAGAGQRAHRIRHPPARRVDPVVEMRHDQVQPVEAECAVEQVQQRDGIGSPRYRYKRAAGRQPERGQVAAEGVEQYHPISAVESGFG